MHSIVFRVDYWNAGSTLFLERTLARWMET